MDIPASATREKRVLRHLFFPQRPTPAPDRYVFAAGCCAAAFLVRLLLDPLLQDRSPLLLFGLAVAVTSIRGGFGPGIFSTVVGAVGATYFFPPVGGFFRIASEYRLTAVFQLLTFVAVGFILSWLGGELRRLRWKALELADQRNEILESITDGFAALDQNWRFVYLNQAAGQWVQTARPGVAGKSIWEEIAEWRGGLVEDKFREALQQRLAVCFEYRSPSSERWLEFHLHPARNGGLSVYFSDITDRKLADLRLRDTLAQRDDALKNVRLLSGLLPICAGCKQIRDEQGNWQQLEGYISHHSQATFSHGLCPECAKRFWTD